MKNFSKTTWIQTLSFWRNINKRVCILSQSNLHKNNWMEMLICLSSHSSTQPSLIYFFYQPLELDFFFCLSSPTIFLLSIVSLSRSILSQSLFHCVALTLSRSYLGGTPESTSHSRCRGCVLWECSRAPPHTHKRGGQKHHPCSQVSSERKHIQNTAGTPLNTDTDALSRSGMNYFPNSRSKSFWLYRQTLVYSRCKSWRKSENNIIVWMKKPLSIIHFTTCVTEIRFILRVAFVHLRL